MYSEAFASSFLMMHMTFRADRLVSSICFSPPELTPCLLCFDDVLFVQRAYMESVIQALQEGKNALLESPTGTGKTLCLLCAALAWQKHCKELAKEWAKKNDVRLKNKNGGLGDALEGPEAALPPVCKIMYCSRTHSQLQQVVRELEKTAYSCRVSQLCVHAAVKQLTGHMQRAACEAAVQSKGCTYKLQGHQPGRLQHLQNIADIEDLVHVGVSKHVCPFYATKELATDADIVFMPYNYVVQELGSTPDLVRNTILILDEAHNVEAVCQDTASFDLTSGNVALCAKEIGTAVEAVKATVAKGQQLTLKGFKTLAEAQATFQQARALVARLESRIAEQCDVKRYPQGNTQPASAALSLLAELQIHEDTVHILIDALEGVQSAASHDAVNAASFRFPGTTALLTAFRTLFDRREGSKPPSDNLFTLPVAQQRAMRRQRHEALLESYRVHFHVAAAPRGQVAGSPCMSFWCMSAGVVMQRLRAMGVKSMLLTSGTLSPLAATAEELSVPMHVRIENPHVVAAEQTDMEQCMSFWCMSAGVVMGLKSMLLTSGTLTPLAATAEELSVPMHVLLENPRLVAAEQQRKVPFNGCFQNRGNSGYQHDLGTALVQLAAAVPHGMLVFFPSYASMKALMDEWKAWPVRGDNLWRQLELQKPIFQEPRGAGDFARVIDGFRGKVSESRRGALLMAVCQGRISEGIDFSDAEGRCVVVIGIPFAPAKDPRVLCKRQVLDERCRAGLGTLSGQQWYTLAAMRVVNQALGRVIRHRNDYGAILLADERFSRPEMTAGISFWAREFLTIRKDFGNTGTELQRFFAANEHRVGKLAGSGGVQQKGAAVGHAMFGQRSGAGGGGGGRRPVFQKPQRVEGGPSKAGSAQSGAQALKGLNEHMHVADAKDVLGPGICDARVGSDQAQVQRPLHRIANAVNRRHNGGRAATGAGHTCAATDATQQDTTPGASAATASGPATVCDDPVGAAVLAATSASVGGQSAGQPGLQVGGSDAMIFKQFVAELKETLERRNYQQIKEALRTYTIDRKLASLAKVVAITFAEDLIGEQLERRLNKFLPRGERYPFQNLVAAERSRQSGAAHQKALQTASLSCQQPIPPLQPRNANSSTQERLSGSFRGGIASSNDRKRGDCFPTAPAVPWKMQKSAHRRMSSSPGDAMQGKGQQVVQFVCSKCSRMRGAEGPAIETSCSHRVCGQCWAMSRAKGGPRVSGRCPICCAPLKQAVV